ncbi:hypothetical protein N7471_001790 [Penicillium samsonianum]|uniref:uncharacterized protein n=1 Tax=Penicillium samsonianum TaxID=1882272 RepID=UPI0025496A75|nr:uncharacterized protein N7471_001790 [Penicillium samsonianum]KAJ6150591.1 hypothetical protein N7471_001790 [Penicillium samsonianum]
MSNPQRPSNDLLFQDPYTWSTLPSYTVPPSNHSTFHAPTDPTFTDRALPTWDASTWTQPLFPTLDATPTGSPDLGSQSFPDGLMFDMPIWVNTKRNPKCLQLISTAYYLALGELVTERIIQGLIRRSI